VRWEWQATEGAIGKSRFTGGARGPNPTDRAKMGTKKSILVEEHGGPLAATIAGANVHCGLKLSRRDDRSDRDPSPRSRDRPPKPLPGQGV
jgi:hypothetical protein